MHSLQPKHSLRLGWAPLMVRTADDKRPPHDRWTWAKRAFILPLLNTEFFLENVLNTKIALFLLLTACAFITPIQAETPTTPDKYVYIISPADGEVANSPLVVKFGLRGMGVAPAGVEQENTGHHHLLIDVDQLPDLDKPIPADDHHKHFGKGQTEALVKLTPGSHTLQLMFANFAHIPHNPAMTSQSITIHVAE